MTAASQPTIYLLPGLDGTGALFGPLLAALPEKSAEVICYPPDHAASWDTLVDVVAGQVDVAAPFVLFAESFSGPAALRFLLKHGESCIGFVACATFLTNPAPLRMALTALPGVLRVVPQRPPHWVLRRLLLSPAASQTSVMG